MPDAILKLGLSKKEASQKKGGNAMDESTTTARWAIPQPWRGLFGVAVTVGYAFLITACAAANLAMGTLNGEHDT